jgi:hypothetical protein
MEPCYNFISLFLAGLGIMFWGLGHHNEYA